VRVIPLQIKAGSIRCHGQSERFNITWQPSAEVNHGTVKYELALQVDNGQKIAQVKTIILTQF